MKLDLFPLEIFKQTYFCWSSIMWNILISSSICEPPMGHDSRMSGTSSSKSFIIVLSITFPTSCLSKWMIMNDYIPLLIYVSYIDVFYIGKIFLFHKMIISRTISLTDFPLIFVKSLIWASPKNYGIILLISSNPRAFFNFQSEIIW